MEETDIHELHGQWPLRNKFSNEMNNNLPPAPAWRVQDLQEQLLHPYRFKKAQAPIFVQ